MCPDALIFTKCKCISSHVHVPDDDAAADATNESC